MFFITVYLFSIIFLCFFILTFNLDEDPRFRNMLIVDHVIMQNDAGSRAQVIYLLHCAFSIV